MINPLSKTNKAEAEPPGDRMAPLVSKICNILLKSNKKHF